MDDWMNGQRDRYMDGWMDGWMDGYRKRDRQTQNK
jgi:hypothetical protein